MLASFAARALLYCTAAPLLVACSAGAPQAPWTASFADADGSPTAALAADPTGAVALAGSFVTELQLGDVGLQGSGQGASVFVGMLDAGGQVAWAVSGGSSGGQGAVGVAFDPDGDVVVGGGFTGTVDFGTGALTALSSDVFLARLGRDGQAAWVKQFNADDGGPSGAGDSTLGGVAVDGAGNVALGGSFSGTLGFGGPPLYAEAGAGDVSFVAELDRQGGYVFSQAFGGEGHLIDALAFDAAGDLFVGGINRGTLEIGGAVLSSVASSGYVAKLTPQGAVAWALQLGGTQSSEVTCLAVDAGGDVLLGGNFSGLLTAGSLQAQTSASASGFVLQLSGDGAPQWLVTLDLRQIGALAAAPGGGAVLTGASNQGPATPMTLPFAARIDGQGAPGPTLVLGASPFNDFGFPGMTGSGTGIGVAGGDVVITGTLDTPQDVFVTRQAL